MKTMRKWLSRIIASALMATAHAGELFDQANEDYAAGHFKEAIQAYEQILEEDGARVGVLQNLGTAYYRLGDDARAILAFERALLLKPSNPDLLANLKVAQDEATVFPAAKDANWQAALGHSSTRRWSQFAFIAAVLLPFLAAAWVFFPKKFRWASTTAGGCSVAIAAISIYIVSLRGEETIRGIITANPAEVKISPFEKAKTRGTLIAGREVKLGKEASGYLWITADAGAIDGWVKKDDLARIIPN